MLKTLHFIRSVLKIGHRTYIQLRIGVIGFCVFPLLLVERRRLFIMEAVSAGSFWCKVDIGLDFDYKVRDAPFFFGGRNMDVLQNSFSCSSQPLNLNTVNVKWSWRVLQKENGYSAVNGHHWSCLPEIHGIHMPSTFNSCVDNVEFFFFFLRESSKGSCDIHT